MAYAAKDFSNQLVAGQGVEQGIARSVEQGVARGREEGMRELVLMTLEQRFGTLPESVADELRTAGITRLQRLLAKSFEATSLEETLERAGSGQTT